MLKNIHIGTRCGETRIRRPGIAAPYGKAIDKSICIGTRHRETGRKTPDIATAFRETIDKSICFGTHRRKTRKKRGDEEKVPGELLELLLLTINTPNLGGGFK